MRAHELDDPLHTLVLQARRDVHQDDAAHQLRMSGGHRHRDQTAERRTHKDRTFESELGEQRRNRRGQCLAGHLADGIAVAVHRQIGCEDVVSRPEGGTESFPHVRRLPAAVETDHRRGAGATPLEVVHLPVFDQDETAAARDRDVVARDG